jgi:hypothetical protein
MTAYVNITEASLHIGVVVFWLLPSLGASLSLLVMPILSEDMKEEGHV